MIKRVAHKITRLTRYFRLFQRFRDMVAYYRCRHAPFADGLVELRVRQAPVSVLCRPRTSDSFVLWGTFGEKFHRPHVALTGNVVILDLGANVGYTAVDYAVCYPEARIFAVEMDADSADLARRNLKVFGERCTVLHAAVWSHDGEVSYSGEEAWGFRVNSSQDKTNNERRAPAVTIPTLLEQLSVEKVDFMKMDIEGAEAEILTPTASWLKRVAALKIEIHPPMTFDTCKAVLQANGFGVTRDTQHSSCLVATRMNVGTQE